MAEEIQIISTLDNTQTLKALSETEQQVKNNSEALADAGDVAKNSFDEIAKESKKATKSLRDLQERSEELTEALLDTEKGTEQYKLLQQELIGVNREVKNIELSFEALDSEQVASEVGSVVGGLTDVATGAFLTLGVAEESAQEFFETIARVEGAGRLVKGSIEGAQSAIKLYNNVVKNSNVLQKAAAASTGILSAAQGAYSAVVGTSTGALKLFRLALIGTGIGAIIVAIGLLISNFEEVTDSITDTSGAFASIAVQIEQVKQGLQALGIIQSEESERAQMIAQQQIENLAKQEEAIASRFDFEINKAKAAGKDTIEIENQKREAVLENIKLQAEAIAALVRATGEFTDEQKERLQELTDLAKKLREEETVSQIAEQKKRSDEAKKAAEKAAAEREKRAKEEADKLAAIANELANLRIAAIEDETERELAKLDLRFDARIAKLREGGEKEIELAVALEQEKARQVAAVEDKAAKDRAAKLKEQEQLRIENEALLRQTELDNKAAFAQTELEQLSVEREQTLADENAAFDERLINLQERGLLTQELEAEIEAARLARLENVKTEFDTLRQEKEDELAQKEIEREQQKRDAKIAIAATTVGALVSITNSLDELGVGSAKLGKALAVAEIAVNTGKAISGAIAAGSAVPFPGNIPAILTGVSAVLAGIAQAKTALQGAKIPGGGGGGTGINLPTVANVGGRAGGGGGGINALIPNLEGGTGGGSESDEQQAGSNQVVRAFVVETEVTDAQANARNIEEKAELS